MHRERAADSTDANMRAIGKQLNQLKPLFSNRLSLKRLVKLGVYNAFIILVSANLYKTCGYTVGCKRGRGGAEESILINLDYLKFTDSILKLVFFSS